MKSIAMTVALMLCGWMTFAQINTGPEGTPEFSAPSITPVSPEAGKMTQYGNLPVNMSAGQMNFQAPIYEIPIRGGYSWPVELNYNYAGLVLEAKPSMAGLGWLLSGGGAVTREVRGIADGNTYGIFGAQNGDLVTPIVDGNDITAADAANVVRGTADTELDKYNVSVGGVNFSFKINENNEPVYLSNHNYKVEFPNRANMWLADVRPAPVPVRFYGEEIRSFTVTDDHGIVYFFDEVEINDPKGFDLEPVYSEAAILGYFSSWHLSKITFPNNQIITFTYELDDLLNYDYSASGYKNVGAPYITQPGSCNQLQGDVNGYDWSSRLTEMSRKLLTGINFPTGSIDLNKVNQNSWHLYDEIQVKNESGQVIYDYDLTYEGPRDVLTEITKNGDYYYEFEYHGGVPGFLLGNADLPYKQDYWGFYNGRNNQYLLNIPLSSISADKRSSLHHTRAGAMTKIMYPTGGYSIIQYEQNQVKKLYSEVEEENYTPNRQIQLKLETDNDSGAPATKSVNFEYTFEYPVIALVSHKIEALDLQSQISVSISTTCTPTPAMFHYYDVAPYLRSPENPIPDFCMNLIKEIDPAQQNYPILHTENSGGYIRINPGTYTFNITANNNHYSRSNGEILVQFYDPPENNGGNPYVNALVGGIRVHTISHVNNKGLTLKQNFDYNDDEGLSTGEEVIKSQNQYSTEVLYDCYIEGVSNDPLFDTNHRYFFNRINYISRSYTPVNLNSGVPVFYKRVKEFPILELVEIDLGAGGLEIYDFPDDKNPDGSNIFSVLGATGNNSNTEIEERFTKGYSATSFEEPQFNGIELNYPFRPFGADLKMGRVSEKKIYAFEQDSITYELKRQSNTDYEYRVINPSLHDHPYNVKIAGKRVYTINTRALTSLVDHSGGETPPLPNGSNNDDYYHMYVYRDTDFDFVVSESGEKDIIDENNTISTIIQNDYDTSFQLKETTMIDSEGNVVKHRFYYPYDISESQYNAMTSRNQVAKTVQRESFENGILLSTVKTDFQSVNGDYKPKKLSGAKESGALEGRLYYSYDGYGNIKEHYTGQQVIAQIGPLQQTEPVNVTSFLWGYNHRYPVLKAVNVPYAKLDDITIGDIQSMDGQTLRNALDLLRQAFPEALITTYTYETNVGVISETDPKGYTIFYEYDAQKRLINIKDQDGNILKEFNYNLVTD